MTVEVPLSRRRGLLLIDDEDLPLFSPHKWRLLNQPPNQYAVTGEKRDGTHVRAHHLIIPPPPGMTVDHINGDGLDCRRQNLRLATNAQNTRNRKGPNASGSSGYLGVTWDKRRSRWVAQITVDGKHYHVGIFLRAEDAARARDEASLKYFGEFARLNFPS